jgi:hypothetical protein
MNFKKDLLMKKMLNFLNNSKFSQFFVIANRLINVHIDTDIYNIKHMI